MHDDLFSSLDPFFDRENPAAGFDFLVDRLLEAKEYALVFETRLMKKRWELGLPLVQTTTISSDDYQRAVVEAAREAGHLYLAAGNIERAWPYFRAIGEPEPVADAIASVDPAENIDGVIAIAFQEGVHPLKGLELMLQRHGMCRAITAFGMNGVSKDRDLCIATLARDLYAEIVSRMSRAIEEHEGAPPATNNLIELMRGRDWLFGDWDSYTDTSHLMSLLPYCVEISDRDVLKMFDELCEYGRHLSPNFRSQGPAPFEDPYAGYGHYVQALLARNVDEDNVDQHIEYFRAKISGADPETAGDAAARVLVRLLVTLHRPAEALPVLLDHVVEDAPYGSPVPTALQLCYQARDFARLRQLARERGDVLSYLAGGILAANTIAADIDGGVPIL